MFRSIAHRHVSDQLRRKLDDKSSQMIMMGYHWTEGYNVRPSEQASGDQQGHDHR